MAFLSTILSVVQAVFSAFFETLAQQFSGILSGTDHSAQTLISVLLELLFLYIFLRTLWALWLLLNYTLRHGFVALRAFRAPYSVTHEGGKRILIVGDSTAFGTGANRPQDSIAGRLAHDFPNTEIVNYAVNGALTEGVLAQLRQAKGQSFDMVLVFTGGNDLWHFTSSRKVRRNLAAVLAEAVALSNHRVIVLYYANFATAPLFPSLIRALLSWRNENIHAVFLEECGALRVPCIELFTSFRDPLAANPFEKDPRVYYSADGVHPSSEGYRIWYNLMWREMQKNNFLFSEREASRVAPEVPLPPAPTLS